MKGPRYTIAEKREINKRFAERDKLYSSLLVFKKPKKNQKSKIAVKNQLLDKYKKELKKRATSAEKHFGKLLKQLGIRGMFQKGWIKDEFYISDYYIPQWKLCIEIDGGYHDTPEQIIKDKKKDKYLKQKRNLNVLRIKNEQVLKMTPADLLVHFNESGYFIP